MFGIQAEGGVTGGARVGEVKGRFLLNNVVRWRPGLIADHYPVKGRYLLSFGDIWDCKKRQAQCQPF
ncbi:hypothetical protein TYRP_023246 [Tyrophagus putrescentiae]|nr:hypothetical protein TYRP_023246 [Tyrophagus putrescentiae]